MAPKRPGELSPTLLCCISTPGSTDQAPRPRLSPWSLTRQSFNQVPSNRSSKMLSQRTGPDPAGVSGGVSGTGEVNTRGCGETAVWHASSTSPCLHIVAHRFGGFGLAPFGILLAQVDVLQHLWPVDYLFSIRMVGQPPNSFLRLFDLLHHACLACSVSIDATSLAWASIKTRRSQSSALAVVGHGSHLLVSQRPDKGLRFRFATMPRGCAYCLFIDAWPPDFGALQQAMLAHTNRR